MAHQSSTRFILENAPLQIPKRTLDQLSAALPRSLCFIRGTQVVGTGAIYRLEANRTYHFLMTCFHVLSPDDVEKARFRFEGCAPFALKPEWIGAKCFRPVGHGDYLAVELKPAAVAFIEAKGLAFLNVKAPRVDDQIVVFGYGIPELDDPEMTFGHGAIQAIRGYTLDYYVAAGSGTSGSPLVLWSGEAIGIHHSRENEKHLRRTRRPKQCSKRRDRDAWRPVWRR